MSAQLASCSHIPAATTALLGGKANGKQGCKAHLGRCDRWDSYIIGITNSQIT